MFVCLSVQTRNYSNVLGARRRQKKEGQAEEDMGKHLQRRPERDGCQLAWSPQNRHSSVTVRDGDFLSPDAPRGTGGPKFKYVSVFLTYIRGTAQVGKFGEKTRGKTEMVWTPSEER